MKPQHRNIDSYNYCFKEFFVVIMFIGLYCTVLLPQNPLLAISKAAPCHTCEIPNDLMPESQASKARTNTLHP